MREEKTGKITCGIIRINNFVRRRTDSGNAVNSIPTKMMVITADTHLAGFYFLCFCRVMFSFELIWDAGPVV